MATLQIVKVPDPILRQKCAPVATFDAKLSALINDMTETMYEANGVGLAAPQIGVLSQVTVIDVSDTRDQPIHLVNPVIETAQGKTPSEEGCLSIPEYRDTLNRNETVKVRAVDMKGAPLEIEAEGLLAICLQHEIDHLNGILFVDRLSRLKREMFRRWLKKRLSGE